MAMLTTVPNKIGKLGRAGFEYSYSPLGYKLYFLGTLVTEYKVPLVKIDSNKMRPAVPATARNVELFRLIAIGIAQKMYDHLLMERNLKLGRIDKIPEQRCILDWDKLLNEVK